MRAEWLILVVGAALCGACGGEKDNEAGSSDDQRYDQCADAAAVDKVLIGEFETPMAMGWSFNFDMSPNAVLTPASGGNPATTSIDVERCGPGGSALHITARNLVSYGCSVAFNQWATINPANTTYFDATAYTGIAFWVRRGQDSGTTMFASVADRSTDPAGASLFADAPSAQLLPAGTYCAYDAVDVSMPPDGTLDPLQSQCDRFGAGVGLGTEWRFYKVPFSKMRQRAYGRPAFDPQPDSRILGVEFALDGENWDFWIDDVSFYKEAPAAAQD